MKKILMFIILLLPFYVYAEDSCSQDDIQIESITLDSTQGNIEQTSEPSTDNNSINLGLKTNVIDDNATYKIVIKNTSNQDYTFDKSSLSTDYLNYDITYEDDSDIVKAGKSKTIYLKVHYATKPTTESLTNGVVTTQPKVTFNLQKDEEVKTVIEEVVNAITNPNTNDKVLIYLGILIISLILTIVLLRKYKKLRNTTMLLILFLITTQIVKAVCTCQLNINTELEVDAKEAIFLPGQEVNVKMKQLAGDDTSTSTNGYTFPNVTIKKVLKSELEPIETYKQEANVVSTPESDYPIYMWFDTDTIYWWSEDKTPSLNEDSSYFFVMINSLNDVSGVKRFDTSNANNIKYFFGFTDLITLKDLKEWNVSNVNNMNYLFRRNHHLENLNGLENWDTSNVINMIGTFSYNDSLTSIKAIVNWKLDSIIYMGLMFRDCTSIKSLDGLENWNISHAEHLNAMFYNCTSLADISQLEKWDTSNIKSFLTMFANCHSLTDLSPIYHWDTSKVINMATMFAGSNSIKEVDLSNWNTESLVDPHGIFQDCNSLERVDLSNWNTSNVTTMTHMFLYDVSLVNLKLTNWDTSNVTTMSCMFYNVPKLEELDISSFNTKKVENFSGMFTASTGLKHIYVGEDWSIEANTGTTSDVFPEDSMLPNYDQSNPNRKDLSYAHTGEGGYLELKTN